MTDQPQTYFEKMEKIYVLTETYQMLKQKLKELETQNQPTDTIESDLNKIETEMRSYTNGYSVEHIEAAMNNEALFLPNHLELEDELNY